MYKVNPESHEYILSGLCGIESFLRGGVRGLSQLNERGASLAMPPSLSHKAATSPHLDTQSARAKSIGWDCETRLEPSI